VLDGPFSTPHEGQIIAVAGCFCLSDYTHEEGDAFSFDVLPPPGTG
jgi:hypothetical protein